MLPHRASATSHRTMLDCTAYGKRIEVESSIYSFWSFGKTAGQGRHASTVTTRIPYWYRYLYSTHPIRRHQLGRSLGPMISGEGHLDDQLTTTILPNFPLGASGSSLLLGAKRLRAAHAGAVISDACCCLLNGELSNEEHHEDMCAECSRTGSCSTVRSRSNPGRGSASVAFPTTPPLSTP
jgi:hypothetical protein